MSILQKFYQNFAYPRGVLGYLAGKIMEKRSSNLERNKWAISLLEIKPHHHVLEIGCGPGIGLDLIIPQAKLTIGLDHSPQMIRMCTKRHDKFLKTGQLKLINQDFFNITENYSQAFDRIYSSNVVQFWPDLTQGFLQLKKMLKPQGFIVTNYLARGKQASDDKTKNMASKIVDAAAAAGFKNISVQSMNLGGELTICVIAHAQ